MKRGKRQASRLVGEGFLGGGSSIFWEKQNVRVFSHFQRFQAQMNPHIVTSLLLLFLATGCADSAAPVDAGSTPDKRTSNSAPGETFAGRERAVVKLTDAAVAKFQEFLAAEPTKHIRLSVKGGGSTGFMYDLQIDDSIDPADFVDNSHGFMLVVDPKSSIFLEGATIDWQTQPDGQAGFKFDNPNAVER